MYSNYSHVIKEPCGLDIFLSFLSSNLYEQSCIYIYIYIYVCVSAQLPGDAPGAVAVLHLDIGRPAVLRGGAVPPVLALLQHKMAESTAGSQRPVARLDKANRTLNDIICKTCHYSWPGRSNY